MQCPGITHSSSSLTEKVPFVAGEVDEDGKASVRLIARLGEELDTVIEHAAITVVEVVDAKKESDASGELSSNCYSLPVTVGLSQEQTSRGTGRPNDDPALRSPVVGQRWRVLDEFEAQ